MISILVIGWILSDELALVKKAPKSDKLTNAALPIANPLPIAAVVFPAASNASVLYLTYGSNYTISANPPALSQTGPYASIANPNDKLDNIPRAAKATPKFPNKNYPTNEEIVKRITGTIVEKFPRANPKIMLVAAPVSQAFATS